MVEGRRSKKTKSFAEIQAEQEGDFPPPVPSGAGVTAPGVGSRVQRNRVGSRRSHTPHTLTCHTPHTPHPSHYTHTHTSHRVGVASPRGAVSSPRSNSRRPRPPPPPPPRGPTSRPPQAPPPHSLTPAQRHIRHAIACSAATLMTRGRGCPFGTTVLARQRRTPLR